MNGHYTFHFLRNKELNELYASMAIRSFAISTISVFVPIYLMNLDYSLVAVLSFYAILNASHALFVIPAARISSIFGFKHSIFFSIPIVILFYVLLHTLGTYGWPLWLLAIIAGVSNALFWMGYHSDFSKVSHERNRGKEIGYAHISATLASVLGPLFGGLILMFTGFQTLFVIVSVLLLASAIPLFFSRDAYESPNISLSRVFTNQKPSNYLAFLGHGIESGVGGILWPLYIFFTVLSSFSALGFVTTLSLLFSLVSIFFIGKFSDVRRKLVLRLGSILNAAIWGMRAFVTTILHVSIVDSLYGLTKTMRVVPFDAMSYDKANRSNIVEFNMFREATIATGRVILFVSMIFVSDLVVSFLFGGGASLLYLFF